MTRLIFSLAIAAGSIALASGQVAASSPRIRLPIPTGDLTETYPGYIVVKYKPSVASKVVQRTMNASAANVQLQDAIGNTGWTLWRYPQLLSFEAVERQFRSDPNVLAVQKLNRVYPLWTTPNDPDWFYEETSSTYILDLTGEGNLSFRRLWHLMDVQAEFGWTRYPNQWFTAANKSGSAPIIAVIDTGCDMDHPDFINAGGAGSNTTQGGQLWKAKSKQFNFGAVKPGGSVEDSNGHGTHVAGLALASGNNGGFGGKGTIGTGYACRGMILRVFGDDGAGADWDAAAAMYYAADQGASVINISLGTENYSQLFQDASTYAWQKGSLLVAAGNEDGGGGGDLGPIYPAGCSGVLGVSANGPDQIPATSFSGTGMYVDIAAPGGEVIQNPDSFIIQYPYSTSMRTRGSLEELSDLGVIYPPYTRNYTYLLGTSMASPIVAGAAGNYFAMRKWKQGGWRNMDVYKQLEKTADSVMGAPNGGWEYYQGYGSLNMDALMNNAVRPAIAGGVEGIVYSNSTATANVAVKARKLVNGVLTGFTFATTTNQHGMFRFDAMPKGTYEVWAAPHGNLKKKRLNIEAGCDWTGFDFWCGSYTGDETVPFAKTLKVTSASASTVKFNHWGYDTETGIDKIQYRIGTTAGASDILPDIELTTRNYASQISGLSLSPGTTYHLRATYTNGAGLTSTKTVSFVP